MTAAEYLAHQTRRQLGNLIEAVRAIPADRLAWQPAPGARSALDQLQEVATIGDAFPRDDIRRITFSPDQFTNWMTERAKRTDPEELIASLMDYTDRQIARIDEVPTDAYLDQVENPWGADLKVIDALSYHNWNMAYHEGQIRYIATLLPADAIV